MHRGALNLLSDYGNDSSDEEVPSGRVSTKRCLKEEDEPRKLMKTNYRLPVPEIVCNTIVTDDAPVDDPAIHGGRTRSFPHERGNWVTYVYIPYNPVDCAMEEVIALIMKSLPHLNLQPVDDFHISLTKTLILRYHWIESFVQSVKEKVLLFKKFIIMFNSLNVYCNEERSRTFIGLDIRTGYDTLHNLVQELDECLKEFRLPVFYKDASFHMSLVWCTGDHEVEIRNALPELYAQTCAILLNYPQSSWYNYVSHVVCKSGNKVFNFNLS